MKKNPSLVVKLPIKVCDTCSNVFSRWCEPTKPDSISYYDPDYWTWTIDEAHFENHGDVPQWAWKVHELKSGASKCVCCRFLVQCLDASPWMVYGDEDYVKLKSHFVGSTHTDLHERAREDNSSRYGNSVSSRYERFHRPRLQLFKNTQQKGKHGQRYAPDEYLFILPFSKSTIQREGRYSFLYDRTPTFQGRLVEKNIDFTLANHWFTICRTTHVESKLPKPRNFGSKVIDCAPVPPKALPRFRLVDVGERRIVLAEPGQEYAALSYVWGNSKKLLLRNDNLAQLSESSAFAHDNDYVPKTFRDALAVAAALHIRYLWIDAICILQDDETQLLEHMNCMDQIYSAAVLTIVSDTTDADSGIPGVGRPREPVQATLQHGNTLFISSKRTFGRALHDSAWESRAWCLQEKVFSRRLLIFTETQAFYHCNNSTWFEDTVLELMERNGGSVGIAERSSPSRKSGGGPKYTAYEAHRQLFGRNFWTLVEIYSKRNLSFENDAIRAFSGILKSLESDFGPAVWGVPQGAFTCGITWSLSPHKPNLRRPEFPSWSWAGWRGNNGSSLRFTNTLTYYSDIWDIEWHHYQLSEDGGFELGQIDDTIGWDHCKKRARRGNLRRNRTAEAATPPSASTNDTESEDTSSEIDEDHPFDSQSNLSFSDYTKARKEYYDSPEYKKRMLRNMKKAEQQRKQNHTWMLPGHPKELDYIELPISPLAHDPITMPPIAHILRFYTSAATLAIDPQPDPDYKDWYIRRGEGHTYHAIRLPDSATIVSHIKLDPESQIAGRIVEFIYISRGFHPPGDEDVGEFPELLNVIMIDGEGEVKQKVQSCGMWDLGQWRRAKPIWKLISLA